MAKRRLKSVTVVVHRNDDNNVVHEGYISKYAAKQRRDFHLGKERKNVFMYPVQILDNVEV